MHCSYYGWTIDTRVSLYYLWLDNGVLIWLCKSESVSAEMFVYNGSAHNTPFSSTSITCVHVFRMTKKGRRDDLLVQLFAKSQVECTEQDVWMQHQSTELGCQDFLLGMTFSSFCLPDVTSSEIKYSQRIKLLGLLAVSEWLDTCSDSGSTHWHIIIM